MTQGIKGDYPTDDFDAEMVAIIDAEIEQYDAAVSSEPSAKLYGPTTDMPWWIWRRVKETILRHGAFRIIMAAAWDECFETIERDARIDWCVAEVPKNPFKIEEEGLHATVVKLQDAEEVLRARTEKAEQERDEYRRSLERWRESAIRGRKERDEAKKFAGLWKEATRRTIRHAERKDEVLDAWRTRALDAEERERILIAERARRGEVCPDKDAHWRLDEALADLRAAEGRIEAVRELHTRTWHGELDYCPRCVDYEGAIWPCKTIRTLEGDTDG